MSSPLPACPGCGAPAPAPARRTAPCPYCGAPPPPLDPQQVSARAQRALAVPALRAHRTAVWAIGGVGLVMLVVGGASVASWAGAGALVIVVAFGAAWIAVFRAILKTSRAAQEQIEGATEPEAEDP